MNASDDITRPQDVSITIVMPLYGGSAAYLREAFASAKRQGLAILVIDDCSPSAEVRDLVASWAGDGVEVVMRPRNYGLFASLNDGLARVRTSHAVLLAGDDRLLDSAADTMRADIARWPDVDLVVSEWIGIDETGQMRNRVHGAVLDRFSTSSMRLSHTDARRAVVELGSFNGNITGMLFRMEGFRRLPKFRETWTHAADWAYLVGVAQHGAIALSREPIAEVRWHDGNLSTVNYRSGQSMEEAAVLVGELARDPDFAFVPKAHFDARATYVLRMGLTSRRWSVASRAVRALAREYECWGPTRELLRMLVEEWVERRFRAGGGA